MCFYLNLQYDGFPTHDQKRNKTPDLKVTIFFFSREPQYKRGARCQAEAGLPDKPWEDSAEGKLICPSHRDQYTRKKNSVCSQRLRNSLEGLYPSSPLQPPCLGCRSRKLCWNRPSTAPYVSVPSSSIHTSKALQSRLSGSSRTLSLLSRYLWQTKAMCAPSSCNSHVVKRSFPYAFGLGRRYGK